MEPALLCVSAVDFDVVRGTSSSTSRLCKLCMESNGISESSVLIALVKSVCQLAVIDAKLCLGLAQELSNRILFLLSH